MYKLKHETVFVSKTMILTNRKTGEQKTFLLRPYQIGDEEGMIACIRSEYEDTYFKKDFYEPECLREKALGGQYQFFVAESDGRILGMLIFTFFEPKEDCIEPASEILHQDARGYGLANAFVEYTFPLAKALEPGCLFTHVVTFHDITQKVCMAQKMEPVGFRFGTFYMANSKNSYGGGGCVKHSEGIMVLPVQRRQVGQVYLPTEIAEFAEHCYQRMGVQHQIITEKEAKSVVKENGEVKLQIKKDQKNRNCLIQILQHGDALELVTRLQTLIQEETGPYWTYQITMDADAKLVYEEYRRLREIGFFFTGLKTLCSEKEQFYMQWCGNLELNVDAYQLIPEFRTLWQALKPYYEKRMEMCK